MSSDNVSLMLAALVLVGLYRAARWSISQAKRLWESHRPLITTVGRQQAAINHSYVVCRTSQAQAYELIRLGFVPLIVNGEVIMYIANDHNGDNGICDVAVIEHNGQVTYLTDWAYVSRHTIQCIATNDVYYPTRGEWVIDGRRYYGDIQWHYFPVAVEPLPQVTPVVMPANNDPTAEWPIRY